MKTKRFEELESAPVDEETKRALEAAQAEYERGETVTLEQAQINVRNQYQAWKEAQRKINAA